MKTDNEQPITLTEHRCTCGGWEAHDSAYHTLDCDNHVAQGAITPADAIKTLRAALVSAESAIKGREHTGFIVKALAATEHIAYQPSPPAAQPSDVINKIDCALRVVSALCDGAQRWTMSVPARPDSDPDLVIAGALMAAKSALQAQPAAQPSAQQPSQTQHDRVVWYLRQISRLDPKTSSIGTAVFVAKEGLRSLQAQPIARPSAQQEPKPVYPLHDVEAIHEGQSARAYETYVGHGKTPWTRLNPGEHNRWRKVVNVVTEIDHRIQRENAAHAAQRAPQVAQDVDYMLTFLADAASIIDAVSAEWKPQGAWSDFDQSVRDRIGVLLKKYYNIKGEFP